MAMELDGCPLPEDRLYDLERFVWARADADRPGVYTVGMMAPFAAFIGPVAAVTFRPISERIAAGRSLGLVESARFTGAVRTPFDGAVLEVNPAIVDHPRWLNDDPYGRGWIARLRADGADLPPALETAEAIRGRLAAWIAKEHVRCWPQTPDVRMFEIGVECSAILAQLNEELARRPAGTAVLLVTDDPTASIEMERWSDQTGHALLARRREGTLLEFLVRKEEHPVPRIPRRG